RLEEAERGHPLLAAALAGAGEQLPFVDLHLAADLLIVRLDVASEVDPLDVDLVALEDVEGEVNEPLIALQLGTRSDVSVGIALIQIGVVDRRDIPGELRPVEQLALA